MIKYYLVPLENVKGMRKPKYIEEYHSTSPGTIKALNPIGDWFLIKIDNTDQTAFNFMESKNDVVDIKNRGQLIRNLHLFNNIDNITDQTREIDVERSVVEFAHGRRVTLDEAF
jgi:hypothetical protein